MSSAIHTAALALTVPLTHTHKENKTLTHTISVFCPFSTEHVRDGVTEPRGRSVAKEEYSSQGVCMCDCAYYFVIENGHLEVKAFTGFKIIVIMFNMSIN